jgi:Lrp/AsnC family leucine-responsive transcriptional regulator
MDLTDVKIINCLIYNARMSSSEIAVKVNLSVSAVIERIKKLEAKGIIEQYTLILNNASMGKDITAMMFVDMENPRFNTFFEEMVKVNPNIVECHYMAGDYDFLIKICTANTLSLEKVLNDIKLVQGISKTRTIIILSTIKEQYTTPIMLPKS